MFPQIPNTIKKNLDEMERESLRLMNESFQLLIRRSVSLRIRSQTGLKETVITPLSQKLEKNITSLNYCMEYSFLSLFSLQKRSQSRAASRGTHTERAPLDPVHALSVFSFLFSLICSYISLLNSETVTILLNELALALSSRLEVSLMKLRYSQQGVLALDKAVRAICNELIHLGGSEIRTNFGKVNRLIAILSCDDVGEG